jgi:hypothetical protein
MPNFSMSPLGSAWVLLGMESGGQRMVYRCTPTDVSVTRGIVDVTSVGSPYVTHVPGEAHMEMRASLLGAQQVTAATYAECLKLIASGWQPDHPAGSRRAGWRPVPR